MNPDTTFLITAKQTASILAQISSQTTGTEVEALRYLVQVGAVPYAPTATPHSSNQRSSGTGSGGTYLITLRQASSILAVAGTLATDIEMVLLLGRVGAIDYGDTRGYRPRSPTAQTPNRRSSTHSRVPPTVDIPSAVTSTTASSTQSQVDDLAQKFSKACVASSLPSSSPALAQQRPLNAAQVPSQNTCAPTRTSRVTGTSARNPPPGTPAPGPGPQARAPSSPTTTPKTRGPQSSRTPAPSSRTPALSSRTPAPSSQFNPELRTPAPGSRVDMPRAQAGTVGPPSGPQTSSRASQTSDAPASPSPAPQRASSSQVSQAGLTNEKWCTIIRGRKVGVVYRWLVAAPLVIGYPCNLYKLYVTKGEAIERFWEEYPHNVSSATGQVLGIDGLEWIQPA